MVGRGVENVEFIILRFAIYEARLGLLWATFYVLSLNVNTSFSPYIEAMQNARECVSACKENDFILYYFLLLGEDIKLRI